MRSCIQVYFKLHMWSWEKHAQHVTKKHSSLLVSHVFSLLGSITVWAASEKTSSTRRGAKRERDRKEEGRRGGRGRRKQGEEVGGSPKEGQRISTELGASGGYSENKSRVCCFRDVNQILEGKFVKKNIGCYRLSRQCSGGHCAQTVGTQHKERRPMPVSGKRVRGLA